MTNGRTQLYRNFSHPLVSAQEKVQLKKSLSEIRSADYLLAEQRGAVLYVEDYTDVDILREWARVLGHPALSFLSSPFVVYVGNVAAQARAHFNGLRTAVPDLRGLLLIDQSDIFLQSGGPLVELMWRRREIENYLLIPDVILRFCRREILRISGLAEAGNVGQEPFWPEALQADLDANAGRLLARMLLPDVFEQPLSDSPFLVGIKGSDVVLEPFFRQFYAAFREYNLMPKHNFYRLASLVKRTEMHPEITEKLDAIATTLLRA
jgi:hypothetical protein